MFKFSNFLGGCLVGAFAAIVLFAIIYIGSIEGWPVSFTGKWLMGFIFSIHWPIFAGICLAGGVWGFLFNNALGEGISRAERRSRYFRR